MNFRDQLMAAAQAKHRTIRRRQKPPQPVQRAWRIIADQREMAANQNAGRVDRL